MRNVRRGLAASFLLGLVVVAAGAARVAEPVALIASTNGKVEVQRAGKAVASGPGASLEAGDRVVVPTGGKAVIMYRTGKMETATATLTVEARSSEAVGNLYKQAGQTLTQVATTDASKQPNRQGMIRPVAGEPVPIAPRNGIVVLDVRPTFTWFAVPGATQYTVQIRRTDLAGSRPVRFPTGRDTTFTYPSTAPALVPGATYEWSVGAGANPRVGAPEQSRFKVISPKEFETYSTTLNEIGSSGVDPMTDGLFIAALAARDAGLFYEADRALSQMQKNGAGTGRMYHLLRGVVLDQLGDLEARALAFQAADRELR
jgi:hypothetical protein